MRALAGRVWFGLTAVLVVVGVVAQLLSIDTHNGHFTGAAAVLNVFAFFTIQSNILLGATSLALAVRTKWSTVLHALRLSAVLSIAVVGAVFHIALAPLYEFTGLAAFANVILHTVTPLAGVVGWLLFGPRGQAGRAAVVWSAAFPVAWLIFTLVRGPFAGDFYPYPFLDVATLGYATVLGNALLVAALFLVLAAAAAGLDRVLGRTRQAAG